MTRTYPLQPRWGVMLLSALFFAACAAFFGHRALTTDRGVIINGIIELGPGGARILHGVLGVLSAMFVVAAMAAAMFHRGRRRAIVLDDDAIAVPGTMLRPAPQRIAYGDILSLQRMEISGQVMLQIVHRRGKASIARMWTGDVAFDEILAALKARVGR